MRAIWRTADPTLWRDVVAIALAVGAIGVSFGAIAVAAGLPAWLVIAMSVFVFAGGAQFMAVGLLAAGSPVGAVLGGLLLNARHLPFGFALAEPRSDRSEGRAGDDVIGRSWPARLLGSHLMVDESVAFAIAQPDPARRRAAYWLTGAVLFVIWNLGTGLGILLGGAVADPTAFGLDAAFPAGLLALLWPSLRGPSGRAESGQRARSARRSGARRAVKPPERVLLARRVALVGSAVALLAAPLLPAGLPVLLGLTGLAVVWFGRRHDRPDRPRMEVPA